jgi:ribosomal protein S27AE
MKQTPAEFGLALICRGRIGFDAYPSLAEGISRGRLSLYQLTGRDFGFDVKSWFDYLAQNKLYDAFGRSKPGHYPGIVLAALGDPEWIHAAQTAESQLLFETFRDEYQRRKAVIEKGELNWAGKPRCCPKCTTTFTSIKDRGQCTKCGYIFLASNPDGNPE